MGQGNRRECFGDRTDLVLRLLEFMDSGADNAGQIVLYTGVTEDAVDIRRLVSDVKEAQDA